MEYTCESVKALIQNRSKYTYVHVYIDILMSFEFYIHASKSRYVVFFLYYKEWVVIAYTTEHNKQKIIMVK